MDSKDTKYSEVSNTKGLEIIPTSDGIELGESNAIDMRRAESSAAIAARRNAGPKERGMSGVINIQRRISSQLGMAEKNDGQDGIINPGDRKLSVGIAVQRRASGSVLPTIASQPRQITKEELTQKMEEQPEEMKYTEHQFDMPRLSEFFKTHIDVNSPKLSRGLTTIQAQEMLEQFGPNCLTPPAKIPLWLLFLIQFLNFFMLLLIAAGVISIIAYAIPPNDPTNLYLGILLLIVVFVTCYETFSQEAKSDELMEKFRALVPERASVIRDGVTSLVPSEDLVVGDIILLKSGDKIPADCRLIHVESMKVDQSMVTGEAEPVESSVRCKDPNPLEAKNIIFNGSLVVDGSGLCVVIRTGDETLIGSMVELTGDTNKEASTLKADVEKFVILLTKFALAQAILIFVVGVIRGIPPVEAFIQGFIIILVANVPQGLPSTITAALFIVSERMRIQNVLVKKLDIIETLGSCSLICTDKTGTLTMNLMTVANVWVPDQTIVGSDAIEEKDINIAESTKKYFSLFRLFEVASLNSRVAFQKKSEDSAPEAVGDATELGLYRFFAEIIPKVHKVNLEEYRDTNTKLYEIPFNSENKWQMSIHKEGSSKNESNILYLKGAPDVLLSKCSHYIDSNGNKKLIDDDFMKNYISRYEGFGGNGERVLGFAFKELTHLLREEQVRDPLYLEKLKDNLVGKNTQTPTRDLCFVGLVTLRDPPRAEVPQAVRDCHTAGVKVVMVTGDHPITAGAIARNIGLITLPTREDVAKEKGIHPNQVDENDVKAVVVHGSTIPSMTDNDWSNLIGKKEIVFARTSPEQKLIIVQKFTAAGNIVAMTGDGVNDSPALKQAAIGVAMGKNGSDVAKEAADLVLLDDNFASIVVGIKEGRLLFANLKKSIAYTLTHLTPEVIPVLLWAFIGFPQALGGILTLCIDLLTELLPSMSLAYEQAESDIMLVPPRNPKKDTLVTLPLMFYSYFVAGFIETGICYFVFYWVFKSYHISFKDLASTKNDYFNSLPKGDFESDSGHTFTKDDQKHILAIAQGSWYLMVVIGQAVHIWTCRTIKVSLFDHGVFTNKQTNIAVVVAVCLGIIVTYTPGIQSIVLAYNPQSLPIFYGALLSVGCFFGLTEGRKYIARNYPSLTWYFTI